MEPSSSHVTEAKHDVFISFRGRDVRRGFLSHLKKELRRRQIDAYVDDNLERGEGISPTLLRAIEESRILMIIFSADYASSKWCLAELAKMIECMERNKQIVIPVFYNVDPSDVRNQRGDYGDALANHEENFQKNKAKVQIWRSALQKAAELSGFHYPSNFQDESDLVDEIVEDVSEKLNKFSPSESNGLVGIEQTVAYIESLLAMESREVQILGIWGMGGIGKTTIARAIFGNVSTQYEGCCFLQNLREELKEYQLRYLQEKLLSELLQEKNLQINGTSKARSSFLKKRLSRKKVLTVIDDVNTPEQLKYLAGESICFGPGSRVIVTSRDKHVLISGGVHKLHEVKELNSQESLELFCVNAFNQSQPKFKYEELSRKAVAIAKGIPLALKVLGSHFHSKCEETWECALRKLEKYPNEQIQRVLKFSYDGLHEEEKSIILDLAFFFKEEDKDYVITQLEAQGFYGASGIEVLLDKALINISSDNKIQMHDLIQKMGCEIVRQECIKDPGRRSRLRNSEEVYDVLKNNKGTDAVEGMLIDVSQIGDINLISCDTFKKMPNLRIIKFYCPLHAERYMPRSHVKELLQEVQDFVNMRRTGLSISKQLVEPPQFCNLNSLHDKRIKLSRSKQLMGNPDLSEASNLERVYHLESESLCEVRPSVLSLQKQVTSILSAGCKEVMSLGSEIHIKCLDYLLVDGCSGPVEFSVSSKEIRRRQLTGTEMEILHSSIGHVSNLDLECSESDLDALRVENVTKELFCLRSTYYMRLSKRGGQVSGSGRPKLHILFDGLRSSRRLSLTELYNLLELAVPRDISIFRCLQLLSLNGIDIGAQRLGFLLSPLPFHIILDLPNRVRFREVPLLSIQIIVFDGSNVEMLPKSIKHFSGLKILSLKDCTRLRSLPELPPSIRWLDALNCTSLETVAAFSLTTSRPPEQEYRNISFQNCVSLDEETSIHPFHRYIRQVVHEYESTRRRPQGWEFGFVDRFSFFYPESRVPEWFPHRTTGPSITFELAPTSYDFFSSLLCVVISPYSFPSTEYTVDIKGHCYLEYGKMLRHATLLKILTDLNCDHAYISYYSDNFGYKLREIKECRVNDQGTSSSHSPKVTFAFSIEVSGHPWMPHDGWIEECGVCPLYHDTTSSNRCMELELGITSQDVLELETTEMV